MIEGLKIKGLPIVTDYHLGIILFNLYKTKEYDNKILRLKKEFPSRSDLQRIVSDIQHLGILSKKKGVSSNRVYEVMGAAKVTPEETLCLIDPFCYLSHFSAMSFHGITERFPKIIHISTPSPKDWRNFAKERMQKDLGDDIENYNLPHLQKLSIPKIEDKSIHTHSSLHLGAFKSIRDTNLRVSTMGRTFLDMLKQPNLCGGIRHVLHVYKKWGEKYKPLIIKEIDRNGAPIDKVRAGYILENICGIQDKLIDSWTDYAQRGGSRKLCADDEFSAHYSERWMLSINIDFTGE